MHIMPTRQHCNCIQLLLPLVTELECSRFVGLQELGDHVLGVIRYTVELRTVKLKASFRYVGHRLRIAVSHERRQSRQSAISPFKHSNFPFVAKKNSLTLYGHIKTAEQGTIIQQYGDWNTGR